MTVVTDNGGLYNTCVCNIFGLVANVQMFIVGERIVFVL